MFEIVDKFLTFFCSSIIFTSLSIFNGVSLLKPPSTDFIGVLDWLRDPDAFILIESGCFLLLEELGNGLSSI
jgi:hypothetical protein